MYNSNQGSTKKIADKKSQSPTFKDAKRPVTAGLAVKNKILSKKNVDCKR